MNTVKYDFGNSSYILTLAIVLNLCRNKFSCHLIKPPRDKYFTLYCNGNIDKSDLVERQQYFCIKIEFHVEQTEQ